MNKDVKKEFGAAFDKRTELIKERIKENNAAMVDIATSAMESPIEDFDSHKKQYDYHKTCIEIYQKELGHIAELYGNILQVIEREK